MKAGSSWRKAPGVIKDCSHMVRPAKAVQLAKGAKFTQAEHRAADYFAKLGYDAQIVKQSMNTPGADVLINGVGFDVKSITGLNGVGKFIGNAKYPRLVLDLRNSPWNLKSAKCAIGHELNNAKHALEEILVITNQGDFRWTR